jgi:hypothetical protein
MIYMYKTRLSPCRMIWLLPHPLPLPRQQSVSLSQSSFLSQVESILTEEGGWGGGGAKSFDGEKALSSIKYSLFSACGCASCSNV